MSSSAQIVTRALRRIRVLGAGEDPSATDAADGLAALNAMIAGWQADGVNVSSDVPLAAKFEEGTVALLAVRLADDYGAHVPSVVLRDADNGWQRLQAAYISAPLARFDCALTSLPSRYISVIGTTDAWVTLTAYAEFDRVEADRRIYECIIAGTSGASGPHGTGPEIVDGSATWRFIGFAN